MSTPATYDEMTRAFQSKVFTTFTTFMSFPTRALPPTWADLQKIDLFFLFAHLNHFRYCSPPQPANRHHLAYPRKVLTSTGARFRFQNLQWLSHNGYFPRCLPSFPLPGVTRRTPSTRLE